MDTGFIWFG